MKKPLTLWDIDGNLVNVYRYHTPAYQGAIRKAYGVEVPLEEIESNYGLPASEVVAIPVRKRNIPETKIQRGLERVFSLYADELEKTLRTANDSVLPGVRDVLEALKRAQVPRGVVTGNIKKAGEAVLRGTDLYGFFDSRINSYADGISERYLIVSAAIQAARENQIIEDDAKIFVFGDKPADVEAARKNSCISVAVMRDSLGSESSPGGGTYIKRKKSLEQSHPDYLIDDYTNTSQILSLLGIE